MAPFRKRVVARLGAFQGLSFHTDTIFSKMIVPRLMGDDTKDVTIPRCDHLGELPTLLGFQKIFQTIHEASTSRRRCEDNEQTPYHLL